MFTKSQNLQEKAQMPQLFMQVSICAEEYNSFILTGMKFVRGFYTPLYKSRKAKSHMLQFLHA